MDAAKLSPSRIALLFSFALLIPASAFSQSPAFSPSLTSITLVGRTPQTDTISSTGAAITFNATTTYTPTDPPWLTIDGAATTDTVSGLVTPANIYVLVGQRAALLTTGTHTANITLHDPTGASGAADLVIPVSYTTGSNPGNPGGAITSSPSSVIQTVAFGSLITVPIQLQSTSTTPISFTLQQPSVSWASGFTTTGLQTTGMVSAGNPVNVQVILNGSGQPQQVLNTTLNVTYGTNQTLPISVAFGNGVNAGGGGGSGSLIVSQTSISWTYNTGGATPSPTAVSVSSTAGVMGFVATSNSGWLTVNPQNGTLPATLTISPTANIFALPNGPNVGTINITANDNSTQAITVTLNINGGGNGGGTSSFGVAPPAVNFVYQANSLMSSSQQQFIYLTGSGNYTASVTNNGGGSWLSVPTPSGTLPTQFAQIAINASGLAAGTYSGTVTFTNTGTSQTAAVNVSLLVTGTTAAYPSQGNLIFNYIAGGSSILQVQNLNILSSDNSVIQTSAVVSNAASSPWLSVTPNGGNSYSVTANASNLANGLYTGYLTVTTSTGNSPLTVPVVLNVTGSTSGGGSSGLTIGTSSFTFSPAVGGAASTQQLAVSANTPTIFTATASTNNGNNTWLSVQPAGSSVTNTTLAVTANPAGLVAGNYSGQITLVTSTGSQNVPVTMIVGGSGGGGSGNITVTANGGASTSPSLTFTANSLGEVLPTQYLSVTSASGSSAVSFTASLSGASCSWVALGITVGQAYQTPLNQLSVGASTTGVAAGSYNCTLTLTPSGGTAVMVPLTLTVVGQPTVTIPTTPLSFSYAAGTAVPSAQTITATGAGSSAAGFTASATSTPAGWLSVSPTSGSASSSASVPLSVSVNPSGLAAGTYNGSITVTPGTGATGGGTVPVTLTVTAPTPVISTIVSGASFLGGAISPGEFVTLMGTSLGPLTPASLQLDSTGKVSTTLANVQVFFSSTPAPLTYVSSGQINCIVPYEVNGLTTVPVKAVYLSQPSNVVTLNVANSAPGIFSASGTGTG